MPLTGVTPAGSAKVGTNLLGSTPETCTPLTKNFISAGAGRPISVGVTQAHQVAQFVGGNSCRFMNKVLARGCRLTRLAKDRIHVDTRSAAQVEVAEIDFVGQPAFGRLVEKESSILAVSGPGQRLGLARALCEDEADVAVGGVGAEISVNTLQFLLDAVPLGLSVDVVAWIGG